MDFLQKVHVTPFVNSRSRACRNKAMKQRQRQRVAIRSAYEPRELQVIPVANRQFLPEGISGCFRGYSISQPETRGAAQPELPTVPPRKKERRPWRPPLRTPATSSARGESSPPLPDSFQFAGEQ